MTKLLGYAPSRWYLLGLFSAVAAMFAGWQVISSLGDDSSEASAAEELCGRTYASYPAFGGLERLAFESDLVARVIAGPMTVVRDRYEIPGLRAGYDDYIVQRLEVEQAVKSAPASSTVEVANSVGFCLEPGSEYLVFLSEAPGGPAAVDRHDAIDFPAGFTFTGGGPIATSLIVDERAHSLGRGYPIAVDIDGIPVATVIERVMEIIKPE